MACRCRTALVAVQHNFLLSAVPVVGEDDADDEPAVAVSHSHHESVGHGHAGKIAAALLVRPTGIVFLTWQQHVVVVEVAGAVLRQLAAFEQGFDEQVAETGVDVEVVLMIDVRHHYGVRHLVLAEELVYRVGAGETVTATGVSVGAEGVGVFDACAAAAVIGKKLLCNFRRVLFCIEISVFQCVVDELAQPDMA